MASIPALPHAPIGRLMGLIMAMRETPGPDDVSRLAQALQLELDDLLPLIKAARLLGWAVVKEGDYDLTAEGCRVADAGEKERKAVFCARAREIPLLRAILETLEASGRAPVPREEIRRRISGRFSKAECERQLDTAVEWGRYAELFDYDADEMCFMAAGS